MARRQKPDSSRQSLRKECGVFAGSPDTNVHVRPALLRSSDLSSMYGPSAAYRMGDDAGAHRRSDFVLALWCGAAQVSASPARASGRGGQRGAAHHPHPAEADWQLAASGYDRLRATGSEIVLRASPESWAAWGEPKGRARHEGGFAGPGQVTCRCSGAGTPRAPGRQAAQHEGHSNAGDSSSNASSSTHESGQHEAGARPARGRRDLRTADGTRGPHRRPSHRSAPAIRCPTFPGGSSARQIDVRKDGATG